MTTQLTIEELIKQWGDVVLAVEKSIEDRNIKEFKFQMRNCQKTFTKLQEALLESSEAKRKQVEERIQEVLSVLSNILENLPTWMDETQDEIERIKSKKKVTKRITNSYKFFKKSGNVLDFKIK